MRIGIGLPLPYLAGEPDDRFTDALGGPATGLAHLRRTGVTAIELRAVFQDEDPTLALRAARQVWQAGCTVTIHGQLPQRSHEAARLYPALLAIGEETARRGEFTLVTVHSHQSRQEPVGALAEQTVGAVHELLEHAQHDALPIRFALELNRAKDCHDPGTTYADLLAMHGRIAHPHMGFCWDLGHAYANVRRGLLEPQPPSRFLQHVLHSHVHDLGPDGRTHWPLTEGRLPLLAWLQALASSGYDGVLGLELDPNRFAQSVGLRTAIFGSIARLAGVLTEMSAPPP